MSMAAGAAVLRSVATKMARAQPRRLVPTSSGGLPSRFSTSTGGSMPPPANLRGPQTHDNNNKKVPSGSLWYRLIVAFNEAAPIASFFLLAGIAHMHFCISPTLDRIEANQDRRSQAWAALREDIKEIRERRIRLSNKESQIEATDVSEGQGKEHL